MKNIAKIRTPTNVIVNRPHVLNHVISPLSDGSGDVSDGAVGGLGGIGGAMGGVMDGIVGGFSLVELEGCGLLFTLLEIPPVIAAPA